jgi:hypothetical protein
MGANRGYTKYENELNPGKCKKYSAVFYYPQVKIDIYPFLEF